MTIDHIHCRTDLRPGDLGYVAYLHGQLYAKELGYGLHFEEYVLEGLHEFAQQYNPSKDRVWVCEHDGRIVGFLLGLHREDKASLQLRYFILLPEYRGLGLGNRLLRSFIAFMQERGYTNAYLWTTNEQHAATALYTRYGFRLTEEKASVAFDKELVERKYELEIE